MLVSPQSMETLPEEGEVFVEFKYVGDDTTTWIDWYGVAHLRYEAENPQYNRRPIAWSYTATTNTIHSLLVLKERCEEIAQAIREGNADEEDAHALDTLAMEIEAHRTATTKEPT